MAYGSEQDRIGALLARLCAAPDADFGPDFEALAAQGWAQLVDRAISKRVGLLVDRAVRRAGAETLVPAPAREALDDEARSAAMSSFGHMIGLSEAVRFLEAQGISPIALKGARLAFNDYPEPQLRRLRDLDLLVPADRAEHAQQAMIESGIYEVAEWSAFYGIEFGHQLPELTDLQRGISLEIHHRLNARDWAEEPQLVRMVHEHAEEIVVAGTAVRVPSMHANLLHLVEHATLHHLFENGPITLADLHFAAMKGPVDWEVLIDQARQMGLERALRLIAMLALSYGASWVPPALRDPAPDLAAHLAASRAAMLRDESQFEHAFMMRGLIMRKGRAPGWKAALRAAVTPTPLILAGMMRVSGDNPLRWLAYPVWLVQRGRAYLAARRARVDQDALMQEVSTLRWLRGSS
ncbi:MAG: nucleotidyltransferase family protein [Novosphingobium meiothermophilum]|uniref:nucleotidyltransferase family protein n=1 Tax=Novosphingobium TaxID=165696 RepID=UPI000D6DC88C|nr:MULTISPECIES: nucleotidyltransferase family protein [Novosphingobium]